MMLSASPTAIGRSSLEEMLDSLRRRDEDEKPKDLPPALPSRPTSRGRLPPARRSLPNNFSLRDGDRSPECYPNGVEEMKRKESDLGSKMTSFGSKRVRSDWNCGSPYEEIGAELNGSLDKPLMAESSEDDSIGYFIKKKLRVWCRLPSGQWELGMIQSTSGERAFVDLSKGNVQEVESSKLLPANPDILNGVDDLNQLSYLNEPSLLHNLQYRYSKDMIYSKAGQVLVAVNPFKDVQIYGDDFVAAYKQKRSDSPHVYSVLDTAYEDMMRDEVNQSIIISGESGAGKTETAKIAMQYLASLSGGRSGIEKEILQSNYILEAFGNAKTSKNENSSRFGKLIEIHFNMVGKICGANIQAFLLDKSRVVQVCDGERSYHIFYQLCAGSPKNLKEKLILKTASEYKYLIQSDCLAIDGVDDAQRFHILMEALDLLRISKKDQERMFSIIAAVLWLGNISFQVIDNGNQVEVLADEAVNNTAKLMGCSTQELMSALSVHNSEAGPTSIARKWTLQQASDRRDALAKFMYVSLFDWLVEQLNKSFQLKEHHIGRSISILDIYGFETFQKNSFEQMCANYANERLQQHFNRHLLKLAQEDYEQEGIDWTKVDFEDNLQCLDLFEKTPSGLISVLDEESNLTKASDLTFANKLKQHLGLNTAFKGERGRAFTVRHRAGEVLYDTNGFLEKNKDSLHADFLQLLSSCSNELIQFTSQQPASTLCQINSLDSERVSFSTTFKHLLFKLIRRLESTRPHFICCIKPNNKQLPGIFQADLVSKQLRCFGILEVVKISRMGYPTRMKHQEFAGRYGLLASESSLAQDPLSVSIAVLQQLGVHPEMYQIGYTKVFLRSGLIKKLDHQRRKFLQGIVGVQKYFRGRQARLHFYELKKLAAKLRSCTSNELGKNNIIAKWLAANAAKNVDELQAVICIQSVIRGLLVRKNINGTHVPKILQPESETYKHKSRRKQSDVKEQIDTTPSSVKDLQLRVVKNEETLAKKDEEIAALREQLQQVETRWSDYEMKMKSMEELWQKQMASLQMSLAAARKSLVENNTVGQPGRIDGVTSPRYYDSDATSMGSRTPGACTPLKYSNSTGVGRDTNGTLNAVSNLIREFEQQRQTFDDDARGLAEARPGQLASRSSSDAELRKLKLRFVTWKKEYKARLREAKAKVHKLGHSEGRRRWWGRITS